MIGNCVACLFMKYEGMGKEKNESKTENYWIIKVFEGLPN